ncbi:hypothetical protein IE077_001260, partial [Cardiosporidium cionae]
SMSIIFRFFFCTLWLLRIRPCPKISEFPALLITVFPQGFFHFLVHLGAILSMSLGAISFTHIVKASEPALTAALSFFFFHQKFSFTTYMYLIVVVLGVMLASVEEATFTWASFLFAMMSNCGSSFRSIYAKKAFMERSPLDNKVSPANLYALVTIVSTIIFLPVAIIFESSKIGPAWQQATQFSENSKTAHWLLSRIFFSGAWYYLYNELAYLCLDKVSYY